MKNTFFIIFLLISVTLEAQSKCDCESNYKWLTETIEQNDSGFDYVVSKKGKTAYNSFKSKALNEVRRSKSQKECFKILQNWLLFFRKGHLELTAKDYTLYDSTSNTNSENEENLQKETNLLEEYKNNPIHSNNPVINASVYAYENSNTSFLKKIDDKNVYLKIYSFAFPDQINSLVEANKAIIESTENLILDISYNSGGTDAAFKTILPYLYTNPIVSPSSKVLSTKLNNEVFLNVSKNYKQFGLTEKEAENYHKIYEELNKPENIGKFVSLSGQNYETRKFTSISEYPKKVAVIINNRNASSAEEFILAAKQSLKVKLFGVNTFGAIDFSSTNSVESPCKEFELVYSISKSNRVPTNMIDNTGIQPDYYLGDTPEINWLLSTYNVLNKK